MLGSVTALMSVLDWTQEKLDDLECFAQTLFQDMGNFLDIGMLKDQDSVNKQVYRDNIVLC
jgi:hypothetical protein